jgi:hypothetical protein
LARDAAAAIQKTLAKLSQSNIDVINQLPAAWAIQK